MAFIPNLRRRKPITAAGETAPAPQPSFGYIDTFFDYGALLATSPDSLGKLPASGNSTIAIIGSACVETRIRGALSQKNGQKKTRTRRVLVSQFRMAER